MQHDLITVMEGLYAAEINFDIHSFWDGGVEVCLGDEQNGFKAVHTFYSGQLAKIPKWFHDNAIEHYPESSYAKRFKGENVTELRLRK